MDFTFFLGKNEKDLDCTPGKNERDPDCGERLEKDSDEKDPDCGERLGLHLCLAVRLYGL